MRLILHLHFTVDTREVPVPKVNMELQNNEGVNFFTCYMLSGLQDFFLFAGYFFKSCRAMFKAVVRDMINSNKNFDLLNYMKFSLNFMKRKLII